MGLNPDHVQIKGGPRKARPKHDLDVLFSEIRRAETWSDVVNTLLLNGAELRTIEDGNIALVLNGRRIIRLSPYAGTLPDLQSRLGPIPSSLAGQ